MQGSEQFFHDSRMDFVECRCSLESDRRFRPHLHRRFSVGGVLAGEVDYQIGRDSFRMQPGSLALINPETLHACNDISGVDEVADCSARSYAILYFDPAWCCRLRAERDSKRDSERDSAADESGTAVGKVDTSPAGSEPVWQVSSPLLQNRQLYSSFCSLVGQLLDPQLHLLAKEESTVGFCTELFAVADGRQKVQEKVGEDIEWLKKELATELAEDLTLEGLAARHGGNPFTMLRRFKAATGVTPHAYRMNCRVEMARRLLQQGRDIAETALECGFFDQSHLHRYFKAMTTVTPGEYRVNFIQ